MTAASAQIETVHPRARSRMTNGSQLLPGVDGRSVWARRLRDLIEIHVTDLGGAAATSEAERSIIRRAAVIEVELERLEAKFAGAEEASARELDSYTRAAGHLRRLLESVGIGRRARDCSPSLVEYLASKGASE